MVARKTKQITITRATAESPALSASGTTDRQRQHLTSDEFGQQLSILAAEVKDLVKMARKVGHLKQGASLTLENGSKFGVKELNALVSQHNKTLKTLKKNYTAGVKRKRTGEKAARKAGDGFAKGSFLRQPMIDFLRTANLGGVDGPQGGTPVRDVLKPLLDAGLLSRSILTVLMTIYEFANELRSEVGGKKYFSAGPDMNKYLGPYLTQLEREDAAKSPAQMKTKTGKPRAPFNRNQFVYNRLQNIVQLGLFDKADLTPDQQAYLENQQVKDTLAQVQGVLSNTLKKWNP